MIGSNPDDPKGANEIFAVYTYKRIDLQLHVQKLDHKGTSEASAQLTF
jgi:hypothetical protein